MSKQKIKTNDYIALSAMLRAKEARLLGREAMERMLTEGAFSDACRIAADAGYADMSELDTAGINAALDERRSAELEDLRQMLPNPELLRLVSLQYDCHNAKALVKAEGDERRCGPLFSPAGCYTPAQLREVYEEEVGSGELSPAFAEAIREAKTLLARTGNPQLADYALDKAYFAELLGTAEASGSKFLLNYVRARIDKVNLRSLLRTLPLSRRGELLDCSLIEGGTVGLDQLKDPGLTRDDIVRLYAPTIYAAAAEQTDMTAFEKAADNAESDFVSSCSLICYGPEVVLEYISALENEIMSLRIILTGKRMGIDAETLRERLRDIYV